MVKKGKSGVSKSFLKDKKNIAILVLSLFAMNSFVGGGSHQQEVAELEAKVAQLETNLANLEEEKANLTSVLDRTEKRFASFKSDNASLIAAGKEAVAKEVEINLSKAEAEQQVEEVVLQPEVSQASAQTPQPAQTTQESQVEAAPVQPQQFVTAPVAPAPAPVATASYANCTAVRAAGAAPISVGQPGYGPHLDRDGDGIACE